jgi:putative membrane protein
MIVIKTLKPGALASYIGRPLGYQFLFDILVAIAFVYGGWTWLALPDIPLSIFGGVIGVIAGFRNSSAYARWWEARTIWGGIVNDSRSFARQVLSMIVAPEAAEVRRQLVLLQIAYVHALRNHLRGSSPWNDLAGLVSEAEIEELKARKNVPLAIEQKIAGAVASCYQRGWIDTIQWSSLDRTLSNLTDCQGGAERIKNTPMPLLYDMFIRRFITIYCLLLPLGMVASLRLLTPLGSSFVGFIFLALDQIGRDLEAPFENLPNDVPLTAITRTIEMNLKEMIGSQDLPVPGAPVEGVLW